MTTNGDGRMKVVVTGGAGYIGSVVTAHLIAEGMQVTVLDKLIYGGEALLSHFGHPSFELVAGDVRNESDLEKALESADAVVHLAAMVGEPACTLDPEAAWSINFEGTKKTIAAAAARRIERFVLVSTCSNYGVSAAEILADESFPLKPLSRYAESKVEAEKLVLESAVAGSFVLRFGTICGIAPRMRFDLLVSEMARSAALGESMRIFAPDAWRPFLHVRDASRALAHCLRVPRERLQGKVFNVVGENYQKRGLVELVWKHYPGTPVEIAEKEPDLRDYRVSGERIRREVGFTARNTVEDAFLETASAVASGLFRNPKWPGHSAIPLDLSRLR